MKNNRTFLEKLLDGAEVEWRPLDEVANIVNNARKPVKSSLRVSGNIPYYGANNIQDYVEGYTHDGEFVLIAEDGSASLENYSIQWAVGKFWANNHVHVVNGKEKLNNRFLYHYLTNMNFIPFLAGKERAKLTKAKLQQIPIPIPPLPVQTEIVRILDALTALTSKLTSELTLRRKQYEYYRDKMLSEEELEKVGFEWKCLKDICDYVDFRGKTPKKTESGIFLVTAKNIKKGFIDYNSSKEFVSESDYIEIMRRGLPQVGDVLITTEAPCGNVAQIDKEDIALAQRVIKYRSSNANILDNTFLKFMLLSKDFQTSLIKLSTGGTVKGIKGSTLHKMKIKIPPIDEQKHIISILEKFETLTNSITEGLPLAIEQSQKRYEYYRELLLNFS